MPIAGNLGTNRIFQGQRKDFIVMRGDSFEYTGTFEYVDSDGITQLYDFTGCVGMMDVKKKKKDKEKVLTVAVSFNATEYTLTASATEMEIDAGIYYYDLQIYDINNKIVTKLYGQFSVIQDVTAFSGIIKEYFNFSLDEEISHYLSRNVKFDVNFSSVMMTVNYQSTKTAITFSSVLSNVLFPKFATTVVFSSVLFQEYLYPILKADANISFSSTLEHIYITIKEYFLPFSSVLTHEILI